MKGWAHIILVGASITTNAYSKKILEKPVKELEDALVKGEFNRKSLRDRLLNFVLEDPKNASAELNTCLDLISEGYRRGRQQWAYLLCSDTEVGRLCASILKEYLEQFSKRSLGGRLSVEEPIEIENLGNPDKFGDGLANLYKTIVDLVKNHKDQGDTAFIHATGGYKPETAIAILAANTPGAGAPVFYIHEHFRKTIRIPAMPLGIRGWRGFGDLLNTLLTTKYMRREALERMFGEQAVDQALRLGWADEENGYITLTEMGRLLWGQLQKRGLKTRRYL